MSIHIRKDDKGGLSLVVPPDEESDVDREIAVALSQNKAVAMYPAIVILQRQVAVLQAKAALESQARTAAMEFAQSRYTTRRPKRRTRIDRTPFGFRPDKDDLTRLAPDAEECRTIALAQAERAKGRSWREVCMALDRMGRPRRNGKKWSDSGGHSTLSGILRRVGRVPSSP